MLKVFDFESDLNNSVDAQQRKVHYVCSIMLHMCDG